MKRVGLVGWRGMVGSVLMERMQAESDLAQFEPVFFTTSNVGGAGPKIGGAGEGGAKTVPIMQLVFFEVRLNAPIEAEQFKYDHNAEDITGNVIKNLGGK